MHAMKRISWLGTGTAALALLIALEGANAAEIRYSEWRKPDAQAEEMIGKLNKLIDDAEKVHAADPRFLHDLRQTMKTYQRPAMTELLHDDFADGDFTKDPVWTVSEGRFTVGYGGGLRSVAHPLAPAPVSNQQDNKKRNEVSEIFKAILDKNASSGSSSSKTTSGIADPRRSEIFTKHAIANAYLIEATVIANEPKGEFSIALYQGDDRLSGYRLDQLPGETPTLELVRFSRRGNSVINTPEGSLQLGDGKEHHLEWWRGKDGVMTILIDGKEVIKATDLGIKTGFDGLTLANELGDFTLRDVAVYDLQ